MKEWGFTTPVLIDESGGIIAGHGRVLAAKKLGLKEVPAMVANGWTEAQKKAYVIADNKLALNAGWDDDLLKVELEELQDLGFDLTMTGFNQDELSKLLVSDLELNDSSGAPKLRLEYWLLGGIKIECDFLSNIKELETVIVTWQQFAGKKATLEATGQTFDEVKAERIGKEDGDKK